MFFSGEKLKNARKSSFETIDNLVQALESQYNLKINKGMVSRWENGKAVPRENTVKVLAQCMNVPVDQLSETNGRIAELEKEIELYKLQETRLLLQLQKQQEQIRELKKNSRAAKFYEMAEENLRLAQEVHRLKGVLHERGNNRQLS